MKLLLTTLVSILTIFSACNERTPSNDSGKTYLQLIIKEDNVTPTVDIKNFNLITNNLKADSADAIEIMQVKRKLPLAMQGKDSALFNEILAKGFTMRGEKEFLNRSDFIKNRVTGTWTIDTVKYQNLALQFFGNIAVLTYRNILNGTDDFGKADTEYYSWADIYIKENGKWKIGAIHNIAARIEYISK